MTKTAQHTSGPWLFTPAPNSDPGTRYAIRSADGIVVAIASPLPNSPDFPEREANAHILAAAPGLLKSLEGLYTWWTETQGFHDGEDEMPAEIFDGMCDAIAKARGRQ